MNALFDLRRCLPIDSDTDTDTDPKVKNYNFRVSLRRHSFCRIILYDFSKIINNHC